MFWTVDRLRGAPVRRHLEHVSSLNADHGAELAASERDRRLREILTHCRETVPFYADTAAVEPRLEDFPVVDKLTFIEGFDDLRSRAHLDGKTFKASTSGSTGTPFSVFHDAGKRRRHLADLLYFSALAGRALGTKLYNIRAWKPDSLKHPLVFRAQNVVPADVFELTDPEIAGFVRAVKKGGAPKNILAYASVLEMLCRHLDRSSEDLSDCGVRSVTSISERLERTTKEGLEAHLNCPVVSCYANHENGILAQQLPDSGEDFLLNEASYHVEVLSLGGDDPVEEGEIGRLVVTDLYNEAMPMIRYDTGDLGSRGSVTHGEAVRHVLTRLEGRKWDTVYDTRGAIVPASAVHTTLRQYDELVQTQFVQNAARRYTIRLNAPNGFDREGALIEEFSGYFGDDARIALEYVDEIPLLASGKRRQVVNESGAGGERGR